MYFSVCFYAIVLSKYNKIRATVLPVKLQEECVFSSTCPSPGFRTFSFGKYLIEAVRSTSRFISSQIMKKFIINIANMISTYIPHSIIEWK